MNMKSLTVILGGISLFALAACNVTTTGGVGGSGAGGTTTATTTTTTGGVGGSGGAGGSGSTTTGGAGGCDSNYTCAEAITAPAGDPSKLCNGPHGDAYDAYQKCVCDAAGACAAKCGDNRCAGKADTADCTACLQAIAPDGCKTENDNCANDI
jgi:hypothetical protein